MLMTSMNRKGTAKREDSAAGRGGGIVQGTFLQDAAEGMRDLLSPQLSYRRFPENS